MGKNYRFPTEQFESVNLIMVLDFELNLCYCARKHCHLRLTFQSARTCVSRFLRSEAKAGTRCYAALGASREATEKMNKAGNIAFP